MRRHSQGRRVEEAAAARQRQTLGSEGRTQVGSRPPACWARAPPPSSTGSAHASRRPCGGQAASRSMVQVDSPAGRSSARLSNVQDQRQGQPPFPLSWVSLLWRDRRVPAVCGARPGRSPAESGEHCRLPGAVPSIRSVSFQIWAAHAAHSAPASLQSAWPGRARAALQKGLGSRQGLKCGLTGSCHRAKNTGLGANSLNLNLSSAANGQVM